MFSSAGAAGIPASGGLWLRVRCGRWGVVVIDIFAERVVQMSPSGDEDAAGALAPRAGDPPLAESTTAGGDALWTAAR
jgi:hypothetical protein